MSRRSTRQSSVKPRDVVPEDEVELKFHCGEEGCGKFYPTKESLRRHIKDIHSEPIDCPFPDCSAKFKKHRLPSHVREIHDKMKSQCSNCGKKVVHRYLTEHERLCKSDGSKPFKCPKRTCKSTFKTAQQLTTHVSVIHSEPLNCPVPKCGAVLKKYYLQKHLKLVHDKVKGDCANCGKQLSIAYLKQHVLACTSDGSRPYNCTIPGCDKDFKTVLERSQHVRLIHTEPINCPFQDCDTVLKPLSLRSHIKAVHEKLREECDLCGQKVVYGKLSCHKKRCTSDGSRPFRCPVEGCEKTFTTTEERSKHKTNVHRPPIKCPFSDCDAVFNRKRLPAHVRRVHDQVRITCDNCGKKVSYDYHSKHTKRCTNDGSRPFSCSEPGCDKTFKTFNEKVSHQRLMHSSGTVECPHPGCDVRTKKVYLAKHLARMHKKVMKTCDNCGKKYNQEYLCKHKQHCTSDGSRPYECQQKDCDKTFRTLHDRTCHVRAVHSEPVDCPFPNCGVKLKKPCLAAHVRLVHDNLKAKCSSCGAKVTHRYLQRHEESCKNGGSKTFRCTEDGCRKIFKTSMSRADHIASVHGELMKCSFVGCDVVLKKRYLQRHMRADHREEESD